MKELLQDPLYRKLIVGAASVGLAALAWKVPALAAVCTLVGTTLVPAMYKTGAKVDQ